MRLRPLLLLLLLLPLRAFALEDFTFVQISDVHYPFSAKQSAETLAAVPHGPLVWPGTQETVPAPSFIIATGDLNEFGGGRGAWEGMLDLLRAPGLPLHLQAGNHDNTWDCSRPRLRKLEGSAFYAFQYGGAKFIGFDTASPQDPRPSIATEGLLWLQRELQQTPAEQPIFFFCHHPLNSTEFASSYDRDRLLQALQARNVVLLLVGHGHSAVRQSYGGIDAVMGGNTYSASRGFSLISVKAGRVRVMHHYLSRQPADVVLLDKALPERSPFRADVTAEPAGGLLLQGNPPRVCGTAAGAAVVHWTFDNDCKVDAPPGTAAAVPGTLTPGAHSALMQVTEGPPGRASCWFWSDGGPLRLRWERDLPAQCQAPLSLRDGILYLGAGDGSLYALRAADGRTAWTRRLGGEVRGKPLLLSDGGVCAVSSDGVAACFTAGGEERWRTQGLPALWASPAAAAGQILCAAADGTVLALSPADGKVLWSRQTAGYAFESGPVPYGTAVYAGAWDRYLYALATADGATCWRALSRGSDRTAAAEYYSPADAPPVVSGGRVYVCDRGYYLSVYAVDSGKLLTSEAKCVSVGPGAGDTVYVRHTDGRLSKRGRDGAVLWCTQVPTGYVPSLPVEADGRVWVVSGTGTLSVLDAGTGALQGQCQVAPGLFVFSTPAAQGKEAYVADAAGHVVAVALQ